jgi:Flp pilus assembly pilin Flp
MEYLVCITFILVALIMAIQHLGALTGGLFGKDAEATSVTGKGGGSSK